MTRVSHFIPEFPWKYFRVSDSELLGYLLFGAYLIEKSKAYMLYIF